MFATTPTVSPIARSSPRESLDSSVQLLMNSPLMLWPDASSHSQDSPSPVTNLPTSSVLTTTPGSTTAATTACLTHRPSPACTTRTSSSSHSLPADLRASVLLENKKYRPP